MRMPDWLAEKGHDGDDNRNGEDRGENVLVRGKPRLCGF